jgi:hypothetical protein
MQLTRPEIMRGYINSDGFLIESKDDSRID